MEPFIFRVRDCYYIRAGYPSPAEHRHFAAHLVFAMERPFTALVDGKSVETVGIAIGSDVPHTILSVDPALVVFIDELTPMSRCVKHTLLQGAPWRALDASVSSRVGKRWGEVRTETDAATAAAETERLLGLHIEWKSEQAECLSALMAEENAIAMLPQPFVTTAQAQSENLRVALDLTEEWDALQADSETPSTLVTGVVVARTTFVEEHPEVVSAFLDHYQESVDYVNSNVEEAAQLVGQYEIVTAEVAQKALPECNIVFIEGAEMKEKLSGYLSVLFEQNPQSVGGALPNDTFYFGR